MAEKKVEKKVAPKPRVVLRVTQAQIDNMKERADQLSMTLSAYLTELSMWDRQRKFIEECRQ